MDNLTPHIIAAEVCEHYDDYTNENPLTAQIIAYLCINLLEITDKEIADKFKINKQKLLYQYRIIKIAIRTDEKLKENVDTILKSLNAHF